MRATLAYCLEAPGYPPRKNNAFRSPEPSVKRCDRLTQRSEPVRHATHPRRVRAPWRTPRRPSAPSMKGGWPGAPDARTQIPAQARAIRARDSGLGGLFARLKRSRPVGFTVLSLHCVPSPSLDFLYEQSRRLSQAWVSAEAALPLGWRLTGFMQFGSEWVAFSEGPASDDHLEASGRFAYQALQRLSDRLRERRGIGAGSRAANS